MNLQLKLSLSPQTHTSRMKTVTREKERKIRENKNCSNIALATHAATYAHQEKAHKNKPTTIGTAAKNRNKNK
jgi:hypothetical protein